MKLHHRIDIDQMYREAKASLFLYFIRISLLCLGLFCCDAGLCSTSLSMGSTYGSLICLIRSNIASLMVSSCGSLAIVNYRNRFAFYVNP